MGTTEQEESVMAGLPEGYLPRRGDILVLHAEVKHDVDPGETRVHLVVAGDWQTRIIPLDKVVALHQRTWEIGEAVRMHQAPQVYGTVIGTHGADVWVALDEKSNHPGGDSTMVLFANELEPVPGPLTLNEDAFLRDEAAQESAAPTPPSALPEPYDI